MGWGAAELKYRFQWTAPILVSRHDPDVLYHAAQVLFKTTNEGQSWEVISPDLTRNDKSKQQSSGGPITKDNTSVEYYCTIFALAESFQDPDILWVGSDDGLVHITRNGGESWTEITPKEMPEWGLISMIEPSSFDPAAAYIAVDCHELDDFRPYIYKTENFGESWKKISEGIPEETFVRVVREDPRRQGLLYAGTETGVFVSFDDGESWGPLQLNLPVVPIHDLAVKNNDLAAATHGRSFWILDDLTPLHQLNENTADQDVFLFKPRDAYRMEGRSFPIPGMGENPPSGSVIYYYLNEKPETSVVLEFLDEEGRLIRRFSGKAHAEEEGSLFERFRRGWGARVTADPGMNRFIWNMRYPDAERVPGAVLWGGQLSGPVAAPGTYRVRLKLGDQVQERSWEWKKDPRIDVSQEDFEEQFDFLIKIRDKITEVNRTINTLRDIKNQLQDLNKKCREMDKKELLRESAEILRKLGAVEDVLIQSRSKSGQDPLNYPILLDNKLAALAGVVASADAGPTDQSYALFEALSQQADEQMKIFEDVLKADIPAFNEKVRSAGVPAVYIKEY